MKSDGKLSLNFKKKTNNIEHSIRFDNMSFSLFHIFNPTSHGVSDSVALMGGLRAS